MKDLLLLGVHRHRSDTEVEGVYAIESGDLVVSALTKAATEEVSDPSLLERAAAVRRRLIEREIFVAIRYGATASSDDDVRRKIEPNAARWKKLLDECRGTVEVTLKAGGAAGARPDRRTAAGGADYLRKLQEARRPVLDPRFREAAFRCLEPLSLRSRWVTRYDGASELALLLRRERLDEVRGAGGELKERFPSVPFLISGPWPLEVFADEEA